MAEHTTCTGLRARTTPRRERWGMLSELRHLWQLTIMQPIAADCSKTAEGPRADCWQTGSKASPCSLLAVQQTLHALHHYPASPSNVSWHINEVLTCKLWNNRRRSRVTGPTMLLVSLQPYCSAERSFSSLHYGVWKRGSEAPCRRDDWMQWRCATHTRTFWTILI